MGLVWFFGLGALGMYLPFFGLYLHENAGLEGTRVGAVLALVPLVGLLVQPLWGQLADRTGARARLLVLLSVGGALGYGALARAEGFREVLLATGVLALFQTAFVPSAVSVTLALGRDAGPHAFGLTRVWGTVGFLAFVVAFPYALHAAQRAQGLEAVPGGPSEPGLELMFPLAALAALLGGLASLALPRTGAVALRAPRGDWRRLVRHGPFLRALGLSVLGYFFLQGPLTLFPLLVRERGGSLDSVSGMWVPMLLLEIPLVALSGASLARRRAGPPRDRRPRRRSALARLRPGAGPRLDLPRADPARGDGRGLHPRRAALRRGGRARAAALDGAGRPHHARREPRRDHLDPRLGLAPRARRARRLAAPKGPPPRRRGCARGPRCAGCRW
jgi:MFS family permease